MSSCSGFPLLFQFPDEAIALANSSLHPEEMALSTSIDWNSEILDDNPLDDSSESAETTSQDMTAEVEETEKKSLKKHYKQKFRRNPHVPFPKIFKSDIRRQYPQMWTNVINWNKPALLHDFLSSVCRKSCTHTTIVTNPEIYHLLPLLQRHSTIDHSAQQCAYRITCSPDATCELKSSQLIRSKDFDGTKLMMMVRYTGTKLYDLQLPKNSDGVPYLPSFDLEEMRQYIIPCNPPLQIDMEGYYLTYIGMHGEWMKVKFFITSLTARPVPWMSLK